MNDEFVYKCNAKTEVRGSDGIILGRRPCGNKFSSTVKTDYCPKCGEKDLTLIPKAFLVLWDTDETVRAYVTEKMEIRGGLDPESHETARKIIERYSEKKQVEYSI